MPNIFISYRRADSSAYVGRIYDRLVEAFGKKHVFKDVDNIPVGVDFRQVLSREVNKCDIVLVVIGRYWISVTDDFGRRRIDNPDDFVRIEVASALARPNCLVVPVLLQGAPMPPPNYLPPDLQLLPYKNAAIVRDDPDFHHDLSRLLLGLGVPQKHIMGRPKRHWKRNFLFFILIAIIIVGGVVGANKLLNPPPASETYQLPTSQLIQIQRIIPNYQQQAFVIQLNDYSSDMISNFYVTIDDEFNNSVYMQEIVVTGEVKNLGIVDFYVPQGVYKVILYTYGTDGSLIDTDEATLYYYP